MELARFLTGLVLIPMASYCQSNGNVNIALKKPSLQSSTYQNYSSEKAVNGITTSTDFSHTLREDSPCWWAVDLEEIYNISRIELYNRPGYYERLTKITILTRNSQNFLAPSLRPTDWTNRSYQDTPYGHIGIIKFSPPIKARRVAVLGSSKASLTLVEVKIYETPLSCGVPPDVAHTLNPQIFGTSVGDKVFYTCQAGYHITGYPVIECLPNLQWSTAPMCSVHNSRENQDLSCEAPPNVTHTLDTQIFGTSVGDKVFYTCKTGYQITGYAVIECLPNQQWTAAPVCSENNPVDSQAVAPSCEAPPDVAHTLNPQIFGTSVGDKVFYACETGYQITDYPVIECLPNLQWSAAPVCSEYNLPESQDLIETTESLFNKTNLGWTVCGIVGTAVAICLLIKVCVLLRARCKGNGLRRKAGNPLYGDGTVVANARNSSHERLIAQPYEEISASLIRKAGNPLYGNGTVVANARNSSHERLIAHPYEEISDRQKADNPLYSYSAEAANTSNSSHENPLVHTCDEIKLTTIKAASNQ